MGRILGLDYGDKTVGVAISDPLLITASALETITRNDTTNLIATMARLETIIKEYEVTAIVLGYPRHMNYDEGERTKKTHYFKKKLETTFALEVILLDERLSTKAAQGILDAGQVARRNQKKVIDQVAAAILLQQHLDSQAG